MRKSFYAYLMLGVIACCGKAYATGVPVYSHGEILNITTDKNRSNDDHLVVETHGKMMDEIMNVTGGPETFDSSNAKKVLKETLLNPTAVIAGINNGLKKALDAIGGLKPCGENVEEFKSEIEKEFVYPATKEAQQRLTEGQLQELAAARQEAIESSATAALSRAWIAEKETSDVAESFAILAGEFKNGKIDSQMDALVQILRLQEEMARNLNTRTSLMSEDLKNSGLSALDNNM